jgi:hypothetical protein
MTSWPDHLLSGNQKRFYRDSSDGKRLVVRADEKLTAFMELDEAILASDYAASRPQSLPLFLTVVMTRLAETASRRPDGPSRL